MSPRGGSGTQRLEGARAVVTGAASGIGRATAILFARHGAQVVGIDRDEEANAALSEEAGRAGLAIEVHTADVADPAAVADLAATVSARGRPLDVLFNNAGAHAPATLAATTDQLWGEMLATNLSSAHHCTRAFLEALRAAPAASVIHHASLDALFGNPSLAAYSVAKGGLIPLTHIGAYELGRVGIRVNCIASGGVATAMMLPEMRARIREVTPLGREGQPEEVACVALFLASPESSFVNGAVITVDGGRSGVTAGTT